MKVISVSIKQTERLAKDLAKKILNRHRPPAMPKHSFGGRGKSVDSAVVVALTGELGSGKTTFVQGFAKALGIKEKITSPTFNIFKRYKNLYHFDLYRIDNEKEILDLGWKEMVKNPENIIVVEWAEKIKQLLPKDYFCVKFLHDDEKTRIINISRVTANPLL